VIDEPSGSASGAQDASKPLISAWRSSSPLSLSLSLALLTWSYQSSGVPMAQSLFFTTLVLALTLFSGLQTALAATAAQWRGRSIYEVVTDRFARTDGSTTATCNTADRVFCGGTWRGLINKLDYIQNMGFTAVRLAHFSLAVHSQVHRSGFPLLSNKSTGTLSTARHTMVSRLFLHLINS
jgi:hypothetical protein